MMNQGESSSAHIECSSCRTKYSYSGEVTLEMLLEALKKYNVLFTPEGNRSFCYFVPIVGQDGIDAFPEVESKEGVLYLCHQDLVRTILANDPMASCVVLVDKGDDLSWVKERPFLGHVIVIERAGRFYSLSTEIQLLFGSMLVWENKMDHVTFQGQRTANFDKLFEVSQNYLGNYVCITDNAYNIIAETSNFVGSLPEPWAEYHRMGCLGVPEIDFIEEEIFGAVRPATPLAVCTGDCGCPYPTLHYPIFIDGQRLFHIVMICTEGSIGHLKDLFAKFLFRVIRMCKDYWHQNVEIGAPAHRLFNALIDGKKIDPGYRDAQLRACQLPQIEQLRVLLYRFDEDDSFRRRSEIVEATAALNGGKCIPFMHFGELVVVCYSEKEEEREISGDKVGKSVHEIIFEPFGVTMGLSQRVYSLEDLRFAYLQASHALNYVKAFARERAVYNLSAEYAVVPFDFVLKYYLLEPDCDRSLAQFSFEQSIFRKILEEDESKGSELAFLVVSYIGNGLNGTKASAVSHSHRNTILYHISRVEKRFGISLKDPFTNQRIMLDFFHCSRDRSLER